MMMNEQYIQKDIMFIVKSEIRLKILTELNDKPQTIKEIVNKMKKQVIKQALIHYIIIQTKKV